MPDDWEQQHGLDPTDSTDHRGDLDNDGYTNLEEYLNATDPTEPFRWVPPPTLVADGLVFTDSLHVVSVAPSDPMLSVHVTLDGSEPTADDPRYQEPLRLTGSTHVRAKVIEPGVHTTAAYAFYERLDWLEAAENLPANLAPGLHATRYEADDWDEGPPPEALPVAGTDIVATIDPVLQRSERGSAVLLDGWLDVPRDGIYTFYLDDHARSRLLIDGEVVTPGMPSGRRPGRVALRAGKHRLHLRSLHEWPQREASFRWEGPGFGPQPIPAARLLHSSTDL
jgi:hexosaminidase